jgi:iron complex transport system ATP-binding protein
MTSILSGAGLTVVRGRRRILDAASLALVPGAVTAIVGPNGSGKSTLLRALAGIWQPVSGSVTLDGRRMTDLSRRDIARRVSFLPQDTRCDFAFTVGEVVAMGRYPHRRRFAPEGTRDRDAVDEAMATCDLEHLRSRTLDRLSGGERQRVAIARCLAAEPAVLLFDEPTAHLDVEHALTVLTVCRRLAAGGATVAVAMHDLATALRAADDAVLLHRGRIVACGAVCDVLTPRRCREVFAVDAEVLATSDGRPALVFHALGTPSAPEVPEGAYE